MKSPLSLSKHLQSTRAPWTSLLVLKPRDSTESLVKPPPGFVLKSIKGAKCKTPAALYTEFAKVMELPDYFGHNWDALEECLADLDWMPAKGYVLLLTDAEQILPEDEEDYATLLEVLSDAGKAWHRDRQGWASDRSHLFTCCLPSRNGERRHEPIGECKRLLSRRIESQTGRDGLPKNGPNAAADTPTSLTIFPSSSSNEDHATISSGNVIKVGV